MIQLIGLIGRNTTKKLIALTKLLSGQIGGKNFV